MRIRGNHVAKYDVVDSLWIKSTDALNSSFIGITTVHVSGSFLPIIRSSYPMYANKSWRWAERLPETCRVVIPIKLEFSASVGFIHMESTSFSLNGIYTWNSTKIQVLCDVTFYRGAFLDLSKSSTRGLLHPKNEGKTILRNVLNNSPKDTASHSRRFGSSATPLREPEISQGNFF